MDFIYLKIIFFSIYTMALVGVAATPTTTDILMSYKNSHQNLRDYKLIEYNNIQYLVPKISNTCKNMKYKVYSIKSDTMEVEHTAMNLENINY